MQRKKGTRLQAKVATAQHAVHWLWYLLFFCLLALSQTLKAEDLEVAIWTADDHELPRLEKLVVSDMQIDSNSSHNHYLLAHLLTRLFAKDPGDLKLLTQASQVAQQAIDLNPRADYGYVALADVLDLMGRPERGLELLKEIQAAGVAPTWRLEFTKARLMGSSSHEAVIEILDKALGMPEVKVDVVAPYLTAVLQAQLSGTELLERLKFWHQRTNHFLFLQTMAGTLAEMREYKRALELYEKVSAANPNFVEAPINASILQYRHLSAAEKAIGTLKKLLDHEQITRNPPMQNLVATHLGAAYAAKKDFANASEQFTKVLLKSDADPQVVDFIVRSFQSEGAHVQLLTLIQSLSGKVQGTGSMHALLGETLSEKLSRHTEGLQAYQNAITLEPDRSDLHTGLGLVYYRMHNYKDALRSFDSAAKLDPSDATAKYNQACVLSLMGRTDEALGSLQEALTLDPSLQQNAKADEDFKAIRELQPFRDILAQERNVGTTLDFGH